MNKRPVVYLPIEVSRRGLIPSLLLSRLLISIGYQVVIISKYWFELLLQASRIPSGIILTKDLTHRSYFQGMNCACNSKFTILSRSAEILDKASASFIQPLIYKPFLTHCYALLSSDICEKHINDSIIKINNLQDSVHSIMSLDPRYLPFMDTYSSIFSKDIQSMSHLFGTFDVFSIAARPIPTSLQKFESNLKNFFKGNDEVDEVSLSNYALYRYNLSLCASSSSRIAIKSLPELIDNSSADTFIFSSHPGAKEHAFNDYSTLISSYINTELTCYGSFEPKLLGARNYYSAQCTSSLIGERTGMSHKISTFIDNNHPFASEFTYTLDKQPSIIEESSIVNLFAKLRSFHEPVSEDSLSSMLSTNQTFPSSWKFTKFTPSFVSKLNKLLCVDYFCSLRIKMLSEICISVT